MNQKEKVLFLYGKLSNKKKAVYYCVLHKCYLSKYNLIEKKFKCKKCKHSKGVDETG